jgi:hypothetical protein
LNKLKPFKLQRTTKSALMGNFLAALDRSDLINHAQVGREAAMNAQDSSIHNLTK